MFLSKQYRYIYIYEEYHLLLENINTIYVAYKHKILGIN